MANTLYPKGKQKFLTGSLNLSSDTVKAILVPSSYTYSSAHEFLSDLGTTLNVGMPLTTKTVTDGVFDADDVTFAAVIAGSTAKAVALYKDTGTASSSPLIAFIDTIVGFPVATNGGDIQVVWDSGSYKIFSL